MASIGSLFRVAFQVHSIQYLPVCEGQALLTDVLTLGERERNWDAKHRGNGRGKTAGIHHLSYRGFLQFDHKFIQE